MQKLECAGTSEMGRGRLSPTWKVDRDAGLKWLVSAVAVVIENEPQSQVLSGFCLDRQVGVWDKQRAPISVQKDSQWKGPAGMAHHFLFSFGQLVVQSD